MRTRALLFGALAGALVWTACRREPPPPAEAAQVAAANSYLESAVRDLRGPAAAVCRLAGPGMCPGHFDLTAGQLNALRNCRLLLRFDFQQFLDGQLADLPKSHLQIVGVHIEKGMCLPADYMSACRQAADALRAAGLLEAPAVSGQLAAIEKRMAELSTWSARQMAGAKLREVPVLASRHQEAFCRWLGLKVVGAFTSAEAASPAEMDQLISAGAAAGVKLIIANRPEGRRLADRLAERLKAGVVVFDNFPTVQEAGHPFDDMLRGNLTALRSGAER